MKSLLEYSQENVLSIQHVFELSDETYQSAIDISMQQNTALSRRRAKEFEKWMNDPKHKELEELAKNSKEKQILMKAKTDYFDVAIEAINNKKKSDASNNFEKYFNEWVKALESKTDFGKIKISLGKTGFVKYSKYGGEYYVSDYDFDFSNFTRKRDGKVYDDPIGIEVLFTLDDDDELLRNHDYRQKFKGYVAYYFYKNGNFDSRLYFPYNVFPPSYKDDYQNMYKYLYDNLGVQLKEVDSYGVFGEQELNDKLDIRTVLANNFYADIKKDDIEDVLKKFCEALKNIDPKCSYEIGDTSKESFGTNNFIGTAQIMGSKKMTAVKFTYFDNEHLLYANDTSGAWSKTSSISCDDIKRAITASMTNYGDGIWVASKYDISDEFIKLLEKERK